MNLGKFKLNNISYEEASCNSHQADRETDFIRFKKKKISNFYFITKSINLIVILLYLFTKFFFTELICIFLGKKFIEKFSTKKKFLITYSLKNKNPNLVKEFDLKKFNHINFNAPYINFKVRKTYGKINVSIIYKSLYKFICSSIYVFKKKGNYKNLLLYFLYDLMKIERLYLYMFIFEICKNKNFFKKKEIYFYYENLTRDFIINKYMKNDFKIFAVITTPIFQFDRKNILDIGNSRSIPENFLFFFKEKKDAFIKYFGNRFKKSIFLKKKKKLSFSSKINKNQNIKIFLSNRKSEEIFFEKLKKKFSKLNLKLFYHPLSQSYQLDRLRKLSKKDLIIVSDKTNAGYYLAEKGYKVLVCTDTALSPYKFIDIKKCKYKEIIILLNKL